MRLSDSPQSFSLTFTLNYAYIPFSTISEKGPVLKFAGDQYSFQGRLGHGYQVTIENAPFGMHQYHLCDGDYEAPLHGTVQITPLLRLFDGNSISIDQISMQTLVSKWLGPIAAWNPHLEAAAESGFNMIHFTPLHHRGLSDSPYSIYDHLEFSPDLTDPVAEDSQSLLEAITAKLQWMYRIGLLGLTDVVWNHIACNSPWIKDHPEMGYNLQNSPHLLMAYELDECILRFSDELENYGLSPTVENEADVLHLLTLFRQQVLPQEALWEYFVVDVSRALMDLELVFRRKASMSPTSDLPPDERPQVASLSEALTDDHEYTRTSHKMDVKVVTEYFRHHIDEYRACPNECDRSLLLSRVLAEYRQALDQLNYTQYQLYDQHVQEIIRNLTTRIIYERVAEHGPKMGPITASSPLVATYFTRVDNMAFANNGWIWNADPLNNFAEAPGLAYFRRQVIVWGDCVKLRYGKSPKDNPWLWDYMTNYTMLMARLFHGFRIDNCHSTPLHVAEYLLSRAREVRPNLYVCAELFTGSEERDMLFVRKLGLHSLIREAMAAWDAAELARMTLRYGGHPMGSVLGVEERWWHDAHALYMDCTHDNETPMQKRTAEDALSTSAIVAMSMTAIGSTRGYDELTPKHLNLVLETRSYPPPNAATGLWKSTINLELSSNLIRLARRALNEIHQTICKEQMTEIHVRHEADLIIIDRHNPITMNGMMLVARTAFSSLKSLPPFLEKYELEPLFSARIWITGPALESDLFIPTTPVTVESSHDSFIEGLASLLPQEASALLELRNFAPGSIVFLRKRPLFQIPYPITDRPAFKEAVAIIDKLSWSELNILLYRCAAEENDGPSKIGTYDLPGYGVLAYSGLQGFHSVIRKVMTNSNSWHPLIENLLNGEWALEYVGTRIARKAYPNLTALSAQVKELALRIMLTSSWMRPRLFMHLVQALYASAVNSAVRRMSPSVIAAGELVKDLALTSVQLTGVVSSTGLYPTDCESLSLSAGLPHFTTHHMRCWGRDIFISLPGLMMFTGRWDDARRHLLAFASCYYHGLLPNLLDSGRRPRYNARDATWWFLRALRLYCKNSPEGAKVLDETVPLRFPHDIYIDFDDPSIYSRSAPLKEIVQKIMQAHAEGIRFREWNAGKALDPVMTWEGFEIEIQVDLETGFLFGGNANNCGTWMDKMGESEKAGNRGVPATPRNGAAVELTALLYSTLEWLVADNPTGQSGVYLPKASRDLSYSEWMSKIKRNFEEYYFIPEDSLNDAAYQVETHLIRHRGIYKDTFRASDIQCDYQLRPNFALAMHIAPALFDPRHARLALRMVERYLLGPLGIKTLSPLDPCYRPNYENSNDSEDPAVARGFNYHQGPEWLWPMGFYLAAWLHFRPDHDEPVPGTVDDAMNETVRRMVMKRIQPHAVQVQSNDYAGLVELTNEGGALCADACMTQAWSMATLLEALDMLLPN